MNEMVQNRGNKPPPRFAPIMVHVTTRDAVTGEIISEHKFDYNRYKKRRWFEKLLVWAFRNVEGRRVKVEVYATDWSPEAAAKWNEDGAKFSTI
jgi:hypothetical protein